MEPMGVIDPVQQCINAFNAQVAAAVAAFLASDQGAAALATFIAALTDAATGLQTCLALIPPEI
jgi:hypothetical protein